MLKKISSLLLSLLLCLSLLPGQARAADGPMPVDPPVILEPVDPESPVGPEEPLLPLADEAPDKENEGHRN